MNVAFLLMAHEQHSHLARLIRSLDGDWASFFVHIDRKSDLAPFEVTIPDQPNVVLLDGEKRVRTNWGGFSLVQAILNLLEATGSGERPFDRYCLLSGADFPIKSQAFIKREFDTSTEFLRVDRRLGRSDRNRHRRFVTRYHFPDVPVPRRWVWTAASSLLPRRRYDGIDLYHGSAWWCLTDQCVQSILDFLRGNIGYSAFHRFTNAPDEIFFHSIVKRSPFSENISHDFEAGIESTEPNEHGCHYIDWSAKKARSPKVLDMSDLEALLASKALFARKFDERVSRDLLDALERRIRRD